MNSTREADIQEVEITIQQARDFIAIGDALARLQKNPDFIKVVEEAYFTHEAARVVSLIAHPAQQRPEQQAQLQNYLRGISEFGQFIITTQLQVQQFRRNLEDAEQTLEDLVNEDNGGVESDVGSDVE